jgi:hypothetical protein
VIGSGKIFDQADITLLEVLIKDLDKQTLCGLGADSLWFAEGKVNSLMISNVHIVSGRGANITFRNPIITNPSIIRHIMLLMMIMPVWTNGYS